MKLERNAVAVYIKVYYFHFHSFSLTWHVSLLSFIHLNKTRPYPRLVFAPAPELWTRVWGSKVSVYGCSRPLAAKWYMMFLLVKPSFFFPFHSLPLSIPFSSALWLLTQPYKGISWQMPSTLPLPKPTQHCLSSWGCPLSVVTLDITAWKMSSHSSRPRSTLKANSTLKLF